MFFLRLKFIAFTYCLYFLTFSVSHADNINCSFPQIDKGVVIAPELNAIISGMASEYCSTSKKKIYITSGQRSFHKQAELLILRLMNNENLNYYENQEAVGEILDLYRRKNLEKAGKVKATEELQILLEDQAKRNCYVSKHLFSRAVDVSFGKGKDLMTAGDKSIFRKIAMKFQAIIIENEGGKFTHFHLNFPPYNFNPKKCPKN